MPATDKSVEFWFDFGSPAAYIAWTQMPALAQATGARVEYMPMLLGGVFQATGNQSPMAVPAKGRYVRMDLQRHADRLGLAFRHNPHFPINTLAIMRATVAVQMHQPGRLRAFGDAVGRAIWADGLDMNDAAVLGGVLQGAGFDATALLAQAQEPAVKDRLKALTARAVERGVFGAPTFFVGDQMAWGQDRLPFIKELLCT